MQNEKALQNKVINYLKTLEKEGHKIFWEKRQAGGWTYKLGLPDLYVVLNGKHLEIELKSPGKNIKYKPEQLFWKNKFEKLNIKYIISNDLNEIKEFVKKENDE